jgi:hypothetical protein
MSASRLGFQFERPPFLGSMLGATGRSPTQWTSPEYIGHHSENPKPFTWTAKAADILQNVKRARAVLHDRQSV